ncbi:MAG: lamin tail domain-containing protein [Bacteroidaceae bacterium]|nr:lamin tail domain-containing protein [Bacteroidaceae bacterium]
MNRINRWIITLVACIASMSAWGQGGDASKLIINEIQVSNIDQYMDPSFNYGGWIELYNPTDELIYLTGLYLAESQENLTQFKLPNGMGTIPANGFRVIWFDHNSAQGSYSSAAIRQVNFKLDCDGGTIYLSDKTGELITSVTYPEAVPRCSYARQTDGGDVWGMTDSPTLEASNEGTVFATQRLEAPQINTDGRILNGGEIVAFQVNIPKGATLRYTIDGSTPSKSNGYTSPSGRFTVSRTSIYRFILLQDGYLPSPVVTRSFIYKNHDYYLPILSIATDPDHLYDNKIGVYVTGTNGKTGNGQNSRKNWNMDWERPVNVEYLVPMIDEGERIYQTVLNQESDFEIAGGWSRAWGGGTVDGKTWEMKSSFRLKGDKRYEGQKYFNYPIFPHKPYNKYHCLQVRNGGNDSYARTKDANIQVIALKSGFYLDCQDWQPAHVFFNGDYLGMLNIRESNNKHFGYSNYGIDTDDMDQFDLSNAQYNQKAGDAVAWQKVLSLSTEVARTKSPETYRWLCDLLDIDEYINYMAFECYIGCSDWITNTNNVKGFRSRSDDGKFHFVVFDLDSAWDWDNMISNLINTSGGANVDDLFRNLIKYEPFKKQFIDAFCLVDGSIFEPERCSEIITSMYETMNRALGFEGNSSNTNMINTIRSAHNGSRISNMRNYFGLKSGYRVNLRSNIDEGRLLVNGQEVPTRKFNGILFAPITLTAKAPAGYKFKEWVQKGSASENTQLLIDWNEEWSYYDQGSLDGKNWKSTDYNDQNWQSGKAPLGYANSDKSMYSMINTTIDYGGNAGNKRPTYYFRKKITLNEQPDEDYLINLNYKVDDGFRIHVNGVDVGGYRSLEGTVYSDVTNAWASDVPDEGTFQINPSVLHLGENIIAVEVHNTSTSSTDIFWDCNISMTKMEKTILSDKETFSLSDIEKAGNYQIEARYVKINEGTESYEAGATPIRINEVSAGNDIYANEYWKRNDWVELYNTTDKDMDVAGMYLSDNIRKPQKYKITASENVNTVIPAHGTLIVWCDGMDQLTQMHSPFKLENSDGASISIQAEDGTWADCMTYLAQPRWYTYGRYPDGGDHEALLSQPTIDKANMLGTFDFTKVKDNDWYSDDITITLALAEGWNWTSHNLAESVNHSRFTTYAEAIEGQTESLRYVEENGWTGQLESLNPGTGYKVDMKKATDITLRGNLFNPNEEISLNEGWNWIGFPLYNSTNLETALENYTATEGDMIIGLEGIATYEEGIWGGTLTSLEPGQSYLLHTANTQNFTWNSLSKASVKNRRYIAPNKAREDSPWMMDIHAYPNVMGLIARLEIDGEEAMENSYVLGAFAEDGVCRGIATLEDGRLYMNIHGEGSETIEFRLMDANGQTFNIDQKFVFISQNLLGSRQTPQLLTIGGNNSGVLNNIALNSKLVRVEYYNLAGQRLARPVGICIQKNIYEGGKTIVKKIF